MMCEFHSGIACTVQIVHEKDGAVGRQIGRAKDGAVGRKRRRGVCYINIPELPLSIDK